MQTENLKHTKLAPDLDKTVRFFQRYRGWEPSVLGQLTLTIAEVLFASRLSQLYFEGALTRKYLDRVRVLNSSLVLKTNVELSELLATTPELSNYDLNSGDPGFYFMIQCAKSNDSSLQGRPASLLVTNSIEDLYEIFEVYIIYAFCKRKKKLLKEEFDEAADRMQKLRERYNLPGRHQRNAFVGVGGKKKEKPNLDFLQNYPQH